jgi:hypothetical protein
MVQKTTLSVRDLKKYLAHHKISPEEFAVHAQLSHMTIRRWLKKKDQDLLPSKYIPTLGPLFGKAPSPKIPKFSLAQALKTLSMDALLVGIEKTGTQFKDLKTL